jgi:voltage-dependent potassium channel beta subunit
MEYRKLGNSGIKVSALSFGSWITFGNQIDNSVAEKLMVTAYDNGVNFFDNAEVYAHGKSELVMGDILKKLNWERSSYVISSKVFFGDGGQKPNQTGLSRKHITEACHAALKRLGLDYLDLYFCHRPDKSTPMEEIVTTMNILIQQGKIFYWGTSEWSAQEIMEAHMVAKDLRLIGPTMEQPQYNMFHREKMENEFFNIFRTVGLGTTIWSPLASGLLTDKYRGGVPDNTRLSLKELEWLKNKSLTDDRLAMVEALGKIADELETSLAKLSIAWCLKNQNVSTVILGASRVEQLTETLKSQDMVPLLTDEIMERIEQVLGNKPKLPPF